MTPTPTNFKFENFDKEKITWTRWKEQLEIAFSLNNTPTEDKVNQLLHHMGFATYNILCDKLSPTSPSTKTYKELCDTLAEVFDPKPLEIVESYKFHLSRQANYQSVDEFLIELKKIAANCNFDTYLDRALRDQFVFGLKSQLIRNRLLEETSLTLAKALQTAKAMELSDRGNSEITHSLKEVSLLQQKNQQKNKYNKTNGKNGAKKNAAKSNDSSPHGTAAHGSSSGNNKSIECYRCGGPHKSHQCDKKNLFCGSCQTKGHLSKVCMKSKKSKSDTNFTEYTSVEELCSITADEKATVQENHSDPGCINAFTSTVSRKNRDKIWINLLLNSSQNIDFEVDSGAPVAIISKKDYEKYFGKFNMNELHTSDIGLVSYTKNDIGVYGYVYVDVSSKGNDYKLPLYIVKSDRHPLLGREWLLKLPLDWNKVIRCEHTVAAIDQATALNTLKSKYPRVFDTSTMGKITGLQARIHLKPDAKPVFMKARKVPFSLLNAVDKSIDDLVEQGVLIKVDTSEWATPIVCVPKAHGEVRICGDYKLTLNPQILVDEHPLPSIEELFSQMSGGDKFTKIDLTKAYLQMEVHPDDQKYLTLSTHKGLYQPTRLMYGIASGPAKWQREIENILKDIQGVAVFLDDIKNTAPNDELHMHRIETVLQRLDEHNMRVNFDKCEFFSNSITYCGYKIDKHGIHKIGKKVDAIINMKEPTNKDEVRSLNGLINYYGRFFKNLSTILYPLTNLLKENVPFVWDDKCKAAFATVKKEMASDNHLVHYDTQLPLVLATDASPVGVGAVLSHIYPDGTEKPIQFASQTLTPTQQRYSQLDREAYAIIFGIKKFYQYVYARHFILQCDNKPITQIFAPTKGLPTLSATRMQHYAIFLASFDYEIRYRKSSDHCNADAFSRLPEKHTTQVVSEIDIIELNFIQNLPVTVKDLAAATASDESVVKLLHGLSNGTSVNKSDRFNIEQTEFTLQEKCLLRGTRVYIPSSLRKSILNELHTAHFGTTKMKNLARSYVWWPGLDSDIENITQNCSACQENRRNPNKIQTHVWEPARHVFDRVHIDYAGPFMGKYFFVLVDAYSKWPEIHIMNQITATKTIKILRTIFATFGIPRVLVSDNGTQFTSHEFDYFLKSNGVIHKRSAPFHPATNGQAEKYVQWLKDKLKAIGTKSNDLDLNLAQTLLAYRRMAHSSTGESPAQRMFNRPIRSRLDLLIPPNETPQQKPITNNKFSIGDRVSVRDYYAKKYQFGRIHKVLGELHFMVKLDDGRVWKRHLEQMHRIGEDIPEPPPEFSNEPTSEFILPPHTYTNQSQSHTHTPTPTHTPTSSNTPNTPTTPFHTAPNTPASTSNTPIATGSPASIPESRPQRNRIQPQRLQYDKNFNQV